MVIIYNKQTCLNVFYEMLFLKDIWYNHYYIIKKGEKLRYAE